MKLENIKAVRLEHGFPVYPKNSIISRYGTREQVPDKNKKIIIGLGCSHTWGHGLENKDSWPLQLQNIIDNKYQVLNMGRCSFGLKLLIDWYTFFADELKPFMCIFQIPDFMRQPIIKQFENRRELFTAFNGIHKFLSLEEIINRSEEFIELEINMLEKFIQYLKNKNVILTITLYKAIGIPNLYSLLDGYHNEVEKLCKKNEIKIYRTKKLNQKYFKKKNMLIDHTHANENGNKFIAEGLKEILCGVL